MSATKITAELDSSVINNVVYDSKSHKMLVNFKSGSSWEYNEVPEDVFEAIIHINSSGAAFNALVRNNKASYPRNKVN